MADRIVLEDSNGRETVNPSPDQIRATVEQVGSNLTHCILHLGGQRFVQTAGNPGSYWVEFDDGSSTEAVLDSAAVTRIFTEAQEDRRDWIRDFPLRKATGGEAAPEGGEEIRTGEVDRDGQGQPGEKPGSGSLKDEIMRTAGREVRTGINRLVRGAIRRATGSRRRF